VSAAMSRLTLAALTAAALLASPASAGTPKAAIAHLPTLEEATLPNGLRILVMQVDTAPVVSVQVWYHAGSKDEPENRRGVAHVLEKLMFEGSQHLRPETQQLYLNSIGGYVGGQSDEDSTHYIDTVPADYLDYAIQLESDRMRGLVLNKATVEAEARISVDERRQQDGSPLTKGFLRFLEVAYTHHPYAWSAAGVASDLASTDITDVQKFYDAYYQPNNATLVVVGKTNLAAVQAAATKYFGPIPKGAAPPRPSVARAEPAQVGARREVIEPSQIGLVLIGWHIPNATNPDVYPLQMASLILGTGDTARLKTRLKALDPATQHALALDGGTESLVREDPGLEIAVGVYRDDTGGKTADGIEAAIEGEVKKLGEKGPTTDELRRAKNSVQAGFVFSLEHAQGLAEAIGRSWVLTGDPQSFLHQVDLIEKVTAADVQRVVKQYLQPDRATVVVIPPKAP
jgi:zinc protease